MADLDAAVCGDDAHKADQAGGALLAQLNHAKEQRVITGGMAA